MMQSSPAIRHRQLSALLMLVGLCGARLAEGQTAYPMLMSLRPVAVQAGASAEVTVTSRYSLAGAYQVLVSGQGVTGSMVPAPQQSADQKKPSAEKLTVRFTAMADAQPGVRDVRIATPHGASTIGQLVVTREPVIAEAAANDTPEKAQQIALPATLCGVIEKNEDVDYFRFAAAAGTSLVFHVRSARLQDRIHDLQSHVDPIITLRSADGSTLAASDNYTYHADPLLAYRFAQAGDYLLEVRDVRYQGNQFWDYAIEVSERPHIETVFPLAVAAGTSQPLTLVGHHLPGDGSLDFLPPTDLSPGAQWLALPLAGVPSNPVAMIVSDLPLVAEVEGGDLPAAAQPASIPAGINGRLDHEGDVDYFAFEAKKGVPLSLEVVARRRQSSLDAYLRILDPQGKQLATNDDLRLGKRTSADSQLENWSPPADGTYLAEIRDVHLRGGPQYPYFLRLTPSQPSFELYLDTDKTQVGPGGCAALFVRVERKNGFTGAVQLAIDGLPVGVTASCGRILEGKGQDGCIVLEAEADAFPQITEATITGTAKHTLPDGQVLELSAVAVPYQEIYQPGGGRGHWPVERHAICVTEYADLRGVTLSTHDVVLRPGESQRIDVTIHRSPGVKANVTLDMMMRHLAANYANTLPPGVTLDDKAAQSLLAGEATQGYLTLKAAADAPPAEKQQCVVLAHVALNFVMKWTYSSRPITVSVAAP